MTDQPETSLPRVFKIGAARIVETPAMSSLSSEQVRVLLTSAYPEVAHATLREREDGDWRVVEFLPQPGRKG